MSIEYIMIQNEKDVRVIWVKILSELVHKMKLMHVKMKKVLDFCLSIQS